MVYDITQDKRFSWKPGFSYSVAPEEAAKCFNTLEKKYGTVKSTDVVGMARSTSSPLHPCFEWRDDIAAEQYRNVQATRMIGNLCVIRISTERPENSLATRAFVNISEEKKGKFVNEEKAMSDEKLRNFVLKQALKELEAFRTKYENLQELATLFIEIQNIENKYSESEEK